MKKCEVLVDRVSLVVGKGSIVLVDDKQFELARNFLKPVDMPKAEAKKPVEVEVREEAVVEEKPKRKSKK